VARALPHEARNPSCRIGPDRPILMEVVMNRIVQANIARFNTLLESEIDPAKRAMIVCLLAEEKRKERLDSEKKSRGE
jgi:hypothetical protein